MNGKKEDLGNNFTQSIPTKIPDELIITNFEEPDALVGQMLDGRFLIEKNLTEGGADAGGIGLVYLAKDLKLMGRETVVKILQKDFLENEDIARKFLHEKESLIRLDHPNIVHILDSGTLSDGNPFMVMEYIPGHSLRRKLQDASGRLSFEEAAHIIESVAEALGAAHAKKIIHRDVKPENIMLTPQEEDSSGFERVRLIDFGIARVEDSKLAPKTAVQRGIGTMLYMSPEQLAGKIKQTPAADIYSLAVVAYEMLTGKLPFNPKSKVDMFQQQKEGLQTLPRKLRPDIPKAAGGLIYSALEFNVGKRPQNARAFGRELADALREKSSYATDSKGFSGEPVKTEAVPRSSEDVPPVQPTTSKVTKKEQTTKKSNVLVFWVLIGLLILVLIMILTSFLLLAQQ